MKSLILVFISFFTLLSCSNSDDSFTPNNITPTIIAEGVLFSAYSNTNLSTSNIIINDDVDWNIFMSNMNNPNNLTMSFNETTIDFNKFTIVAIFDNVRPTGGFQITVSSIVENANNIVVNVNYIGHGDSTQMPTHPYCVVKFPKSSKPIVFQ